MYFCQVMEVPLMSSFGKQEKFLIKHTIQAVLAGTLIRE